MFNRDRWQEILEVLTTNWFRTVLTAFGVFWGILILIILLAAGKGLENGVKSDFGGLATNTMNIWARRTTMPHAGLPKNRRFNFKLDDVKALNENIPNIKYVSPRNQLGGYSGASPNVIRGLRTGSYDVYGDYPEIIEQEPMAISSGRFINHGDIAEKRKVAVIGNGVRNELYDLGEEVLGTYIKIRGVNFMVIGTYKNNSDRQGEQGEKRIFMPFTSFAQAFNTADRVGWMAITAEDGSPVTNIKMDIVNLMKERHKVHPDDSRAIGYNDIYEEFSKIDRLFAALKLVAYFVGTLVLLSGIIGVSNIMLIVVKERTKEIGIRRALGEKPWSIKKQILLESIFLTIMSGMLGIVIGALFIYGINALMDASGPVDMFMNPSVNLGVVMIALTILIIAGLLAGYIPAQSAIKVKPIEALRTE